MIFKRMLTTRVFLRKNEKKAFVLTNNLYLCTVKIVGYGVMVTQQILVLSFLVRVQIAQHVFTFLK